MSAADPPDEELSSLGEVSSLVLAAEGILSEGVLAELSSLSHSSDEGGLRASVERVLEEGVSPCCRFAERVTSSNVGSAVTLLDFALSTEFRKYHFYSFHVAVSVRQVNSSRQLYEKDANKTKSTYRRHYFMYLSGAIALGGLGLL